ncbi:hypothetical protein AHAS_Ahas01G0132800 [Arachis hypogaea]
MADDFRKMSSEKKVIVDEMGFCALSHIPSLNVTHKLLKGLATSFNFYENTLIKRYGKISITPVKIRDALDLIVIGDAFSEKIINKDITEEQKKVIKNFKGSSLSSLTKYLLEMSIDGDKNSLKFKRIFILFLQKMLLIANNHEQRLPNSHASNP